MSFSTTNAFQIKSESERVSTRGESERGTPRGKRGDFKKSRGPSQLTLASASGTNFKDFAPKTDTFEFTVHKHGPGTRTYDIASTYVRIITAIVLNIEVSYEGPKITMTGNRNDLKKVMSALIAAFQVRKNSFNETGKHKDAVIAGKEQLTYLLKQEFVPEVKEDDASTNDVTSESTREVDDHSSIGKNTFANLEVEEYVPETETTTVEETVEEPASVAEPVEEPASVAEPTKLSKKQRKAQARMNYEELKFGPSLVLGGP